MKKNLLTAVNARREAESLPYTVLSFCETLNKIVKKRISVRRRRSA